MRTNGFSGTLLELFEHCHQHGPNAATILAYEAWLHEQFKIAGNIIPFRKHAPHQRGSELPHSNICFVATDNEPLAWLTENAAKKLPAMRDLLTTKQMPISWNLSTRPGFACKAGGVATKFRVHGMKLAHIENAGMIATATPNELFERSRRTMSLANVFLFPSTRIFEIKLTNIPAGVTVDQKRPEEDPYIRALAKSWLEDKLKSSDSRWTNSLTPELSTIAEWRAVASTILVNISPKHRNSQGTPTVGSKPASLKEKSPQASPSKTSYEGACPRKEKSLKLSLEDAVDVLKQWRSEYPDAKRLDGGPPPSSNPSPWIYFGVSGYIDGEDDFAATKTDATFRGSSYNGIVNFHGDTPVDAIDRFIEAYDSCEKYQDVLRPSATYEFSTLPNGRNQKQKFALNGFDGVEGFFLYHDEI